MPQAKREWCPLEAKVGLLPAGGLSPVLAMNVAELATRMPYAQTQDVLAMFRPYAPSTRTICGVIDLVGAHAEAVLDAAPCEGGDVVQIQVDGRGAPKIRPAEYEKRCRSHKKGTGRRALGKRRRVQYQPSTERTRQAKKRRTRGKKAARKKQVTVGLIYALTQKPSGAWEGPVGKFIARFGDAEEVFKRLKKTLDRMGDAVKQVVFISDGAPQYRRLQLKYFPSAIPVVDFYHVSEYLYKAGETVYKEGSAELKEFVGQLTRAYKAVTCWKTKPSLF